MLRISQNYKLNLYFQGVVGKVAVDTQRRK